MQTLKVTFILLMLLGISICAHAAQPAAAPADEGAPAAQPAPAADTGVAIWPAVEEKAPAPKGDTGRNVVLTYRSNGGEPKVIKGKLLAVYTELVPGYSTDKREWTPLPHFTGYGEGARVMVEYKNVKKILFDRTFEKENREEIEVACDSDPDVSAHYLECKQHNRYTIQGTGNRGYILRFISPKKLMFVIKDKGGAVHYESFYLDDIVTNNQKDEDKISQEAMEAAMMDEYRKCPESLVFE